ncbi:diguanylate cyclase response regulator, partial [Lysobacter sp. D1-1-M9]
MLLIENSRAYAALLAAELREQLGIGVVIAASLREAQQRLAEDNDYFLALTGLVLPDAGAELITDTLARAGIPMVVATGVYDEAIRSSMADLPIIDYVL